MLDQELAKRQGNIQAAADALGLPMRTLNDRMRRCGLKSKRLRVIRKLAAGWG